MKFRISERFRLELHWDTVKYETEGEALFTGCRFIGPVLKEVSQVLPNDSMALDFANQYIVFVRHFYIAKLSWGEVRHNPEAIYLYNAILKNKYVNSVPKLYSDDHIVIDTSGHENEKHQYNLVYPSYLIRYDGELYNFKE